MVASIEVSSIMRVPEEEEENAKIDSSCIYSNAHEDNPALQDDDVGEDAVDDDCDNYDEFDDDDDVHSGSKLAVNISEPGEHDVLLGRGGGTNNHSGNVKFRKLVNEHKLRYLACSKVDKPKVARDVVDLWRKLIPPGRFLARKEESKRKGPGSVKAVDNVWFEVGDKKAREKASQCLRERTPDVLPYIKHLRDQQNAITEHGVTMVQHQLQMQQHEQQMQHQKLHHQQQQQQQQHLHNSHNTIGTNPQAKKKLPLQQNHPDLQSSMAFQPTLFPSSLNSPVQSNNIFPQQQHQPPLAFPRRNSMPVQALHPNSSTTTSSSNNMNNMNNMNMTHLNGQANSRSIRPPGTMGLLSTNNNINSNNMNNMNNTNDINNNRIAMPNHRRGSLPAAMHLQSNQSNQSNTLGNHNAFPRAHHPGRLNGAVINRRCSLPGMSQQQQMIMSQQRQQQQLALEGMMYDNCVPETDDEEDFYVVPGDQNDLEIYQQNIMFLEHQQMQQMQQFQQMQQMQQMHRLRHLQQQQMQQQQMQQQQMQHPRINQQQRMALSHHQQQQQMQKNQQLQQMSRGTHLGGVVPVLPTSFDESAGNTLLVSQPQRISQRKRSGTGIGRNRSINEMVMTLGGIDDGECDAEGKSRNGCAPNGGSYGMDSVPPTNSGLPLPISCNKSMSVPRRLKPSVTGIDTRIMKSLPKNALMKSRFGNEQDTLTSSEPQHDQKTSTSSTSIINAIGPTDTPEDLLTSQRGSVATNTGEEPRNTSSHNIDTTSYLLQPADLHGDDNELSLEEYRQQLEEYISNTMNQQKSNNGVHIDVPSYHDQDNDIEDNNHLLTSLFGNNIAAVTQDGSDLEDDWEKEKEKTHRRVKGRSNPSGGYNDSQMKQRGVGRTASGMSGISTYTKGASTTMGMSLVSGMSCLSDMMSATGTDHELVVQQTRSDRKAKMLHHKSVMSSSNSIMSELTDLSQNIDNLSLCDENGDDDLCTNEI